ncbi:glutamate ligase domain-containing protein, partial [Halobium palmae]
MTVGSDGLASPTEEAVTVDGADWSLETRLSLLGRHQALNAGIAATLARQVASVDEDVLERGLRRAHWPGRFEIVSTEPRVVLDGAHNPDACSKLASLVDRYEYENLHLVFGAMRDKDHTAMLDHLRPFDSVTFCRPDVDRAENPDTFEHLVREEEEDCRVETADAVLDAVDRTVRRASPDDFVLVTGSLYTVGEARDRWTRTLLPNRTTSERDLRDALSRSQVPDVQASELTDDVHRITIKTTCRPARAKRLVELTFSVGGTAASSGLERLHQHVDVVLNGSRAQFRDLVERLDGSGGELGGIASQLRAVLDRDGRSRRGAFLPDDGPAVMGILNVTPDSFHDGGEYERTDAAVERGETLLADGADVLD